MEAQARKTEEVESMEAIEEDCIQNIFEGDVQAALNASQVLLAEAKSPEMRTKFEIGRDYCFRQLALLREMKSSVEVDPETEEEYGNTATLWS